MKIVKLSIALTVAAIIANLAVCAEAQTFKTLLAFSGSNGGNPISGVIFDPAGNLYGTTFDGGNLSLCTLYSGCGAVFELSPTSGGEWQDTTLFRFSTVSTGALPSSGLLLTSTGDLVGTTFNGGTSPHCGGGVAGCGLVFELSPASGSWEETVPHYFNNLVGGGSSSGGLISDSAGNLYGTSSIGGNTKDCSSFGCGTVFRLTPTSSGGWQETVLFVFPGGKSGASPAASLVFDAAGNLYGTTTAGGNLSPSCATSAGSGCGVVFELSPNGSGGWKEAVLHTFTGGADGAYPVGSLVLDGAGNLYSTTFGGGIPNSACGIGCGVVFELSPNGSGGWKETLIHRFTGGADGATPAAGVIIDSAGNLYGTTEFGGNLTACPPYNGCGVAFEFSPTSGGGWTETMLHVFTGGFDGSLPEAPLTLDNSGNLYGTTSAGASGFGTVFEVTP